MDELAVDPPTDRRDFHIAIVCALPDEAEAVEAILDIRYKDYETIPRDPNAYTLGKIGQHNVVIVHLGGMGKVEAAGASAHVLHTFEGIDFALVAGICGGVPFYGSEKNEILLGDVIISNGVIQYDLGRRNVNGFERKAELTSTLGRHSTSIRNFLKRLELSSRKASLQQRMYKHLEYIQQKLGDRWKYPDLEEDVLFESNYRHKHKPKLGSKCTCNEDRENDSVCEEASRETCKEIGCNGSPISRNRATSYSHPHVHIGTIGSADTVLKSGEHRDKISRKEKLIAFEMESAGVWDCFRQVLVIKSVCDYADSHKNDVFHRFAAATSASCAKAFLEELRLDTRDQDNSRLDTRSDVNTTSTLLSFQRNKNFVGRESLLTQLESDLINTKTSSKMAIFGLGGIGKTQTANEFAYLVKERHPEYSIFWVPSANETTFEQGYLDIAQNIGTPVTQAGVQDIKNSTKQLVKQNLSREEAGPWLMILDNADDWNVWFDRSKGHDILYDYLPTSSKGFILMTTRNDQVAIDFAGTAIKRVEEMDKLTAKLMLQGLLIKKNIIDDDKEITQKLLEKLCYLPLAIAQAAAYLNKNRSLVTIAKYLALLDNPSDKTIQILSKNFVVDGRYQFQLNPVTTTWLVSFEAIANQNELAVEYLSYMSCLDPKAIPISILPTPGLDQDEAISLLASYSFVTKRINDAFDVHELVHLVTRNWLKDNKKYETCVAETIEKLADIFPEADPIQRPLWRSYFSHVRHALTLRKCFVTPKEFKLITNYIECLIEDRHVNEAEILLLQAINQSKQVYKPAEDMIQTLNLQLAAVFFYQGRDDESEKLVQEVVDKRQKLLGSEDEATLKSMAYLVDIYITRGKFKLAEELGLTVLNTRKRILGLEHTDTQRVMGSLGQIHYVQGRYQDAERLQAQVLDLRKRLLGPEHPDSLIAMGNLAVTYHHQGRYKDAERLQTQVLDLRKRLLGPEHPDSLRAMANLAVTYHHQGQYKDAERLETQVLDLRKRLLGPEHPDSLRAMANLAVTYRHQGRYKDAERLQTQVLDLRKRLLGPEHPESLIAMGNLAVTYRHQGRYKDAERLQTQVLDLSKRLLGPEHPESLIAMANLAWTLWWRNNREEAIKLMKSCLDSRLKVLGPEHPDTKDTLTWVIDWE